MVVLLIAGVVNVLPDAIAIPPKGFANHCIPPPLEEEPLKETVPAPQRVPGVTDATA